MSAIHLVEVGLAWPPEPFLCRKLEGLAARGLRVTVAAEVPRSRRKEALSGVALLRLGHAREPRAVTAFWVFVDGVRLAARGPRRLLRVMRASRKPQLLRAALPLVLADADVVQFEWEGSALRFLPLFDQLDCPIVAGCRGSGINIYPHVGYRGRAERYSLVFAKAAAVHCVSDAIKREAARYGLDDAKARVIRAGVDTDFFRPGQRADATELRVVGVGDLTWVKGYDYALDAIALLVCEGVPAHYEIVGPDPGPERGVPPDRRRLLYLIHELGLKGRVRLLGGLPPQQVRERLHGADVLLQASVAEGIPNAVLEAMACEVPVVVTDCGGLREAITDGVEGFISPPRSPAALAAALAALWQDRALARRMGQAGRARVLAEFTLPRQLDDFVRLYEEVTRSRR